MTLDSLASGEIGIDGSSGVGMVSVEKTAGELVIVKTSCTSDVAGDAALGLNAPAPERRA